MFPIFYSIIDLWENLKDVLSALNYEIFLEIFMGKKINSFFFTTFLYFS